MSGLQRNKQNFVVSCLALHFFVYCLSVDQDLNSCCVFLFMPYTNLELCIQLVFQRDKRALFIVAVTMYIAGQILEIVRLLTTCNNSSAGIFVIRTRYVYVCTFIDDILYGGARFTCAPILLSGIYQSLSCRILIQCSSYSMPIVVNRYLNNYFFRRNVSVLNDE